MFGQRERLLERQALAAQRSGEPVETELGPTRFERAVREGPEPAASLVPLAETSTSCPPGASNPTPNSRLPPSGVPASFEKAARSADRPATEPRISPVSRAIRRLPSIVLSATASRKCGRTTSEFPF